MAARARDNFGNKYGTIYTLDDQSMRTVHEQAGFQLAAIGLSIGLGVFGGLVAGFITSS